MKAITKEHWYYAVFGLAMGAVLSMGGLSDFEQINGLFLFENLPLLFVFALSIGLNMIGFFLFFRNKKLSKKSYIKGTIPGSVLFGVGWAVTGACPSIALVQLGEGKLAAIVTIFGIYSGVWLFRRFVIANPSFDNGICGEE